MTTTATKPTTTIDNEAEARELVEDVLLNTDFDNPEALLRLLVRLNGMDALNHIQNALRFLIQEAYTRSHAFHEAVDALTGDEATIRPDAPDPESDRAALIEEIDAGKLAAARARLGRMSQMVAYEKQLLVEPVAGAALVNVVSSTSGATPVFCEWLTGADELRLLEFLETLKPITSAA